MTALLNDKVVVTWEVSDLNAFPGFSRDPGKGGRIKSIVMTGDWPKEDPKDLMRAVPADATADRETSAE